MWGGMLKPKQVNLILKMQQLCILAVCKKGKNAPIEGLFKELKVHTFPTLIKYKLAKFGYKAMNELYPTPIIQLLNSQGGAKTHRCPTSNKKTPNIQKHQPTVYNNSFLCRGLMTYRNLPAILKRKPSLQSFNKQLKLLD